jgi:molecular chaperone Hsp33
VPELSDESAGPADDRGADDLIRPFQVETGGIRGRLVRLGPALDRIIRRHAYPAPVAALLAEAVALAAMLAGALKYDGIFTLQTRGDGPVRLLVADVTTAGALRGYAQFDEDAVAAAAGQPGAAVPRLLGAGHLAFTVDQGEHSERYQGLVELEGATLAECIHHYFRQSEQLRTGLAVAAGPDPESGWRAGGIMLQRLPPESGADVEEVEAADDAWHEALVRLGTCGAAELTDPTLDADTLLFRLFHDAGIRVYPAHALEDRCRCSRTRIETVLRALPDEDRAHLAIDGVVRVTCEFCSTEYRFDEAAILALAQHQDAPPSP